MAAGFEGIESHSIGSTYLTNDKGANKLAGAEHEGYQAMERILQKDQVTASKLGAILDKILTTKDELERADDEKKDKVTKVRSP